MSLTHGPAETRQHIWSFVGARYEQDPNYNTRVTCPCTNTNISWPHQVPSFINNDYFCDTGSPGPGASFTTYYTDDPLWDGEGCGSTSTCCEFNTPPWFCKSLPQPTSNDLKIRNCYGNPSSYEDNLIKLIDVYVTAPNIELNLRHAFYKELKYIINIETMFYTLTDTHMYCNFVLLYLYLISTPIPPLFIKDLA